MVERYFHCCDHPRDETSLEPLFVRLVQASMNYLN